MLIRYELSQKELVAVGGLRMLFRREPVITTETSEYWKILAVFIVGAALNA